jgi:hypothetical protein
MAAVREGAGSVLPNGSNQRRQITMKSALRSLGRPLHLICYAAVTELTVVAGLDPHST